MAYKTKYTTSLYGRRLGLQKMTTPETGGQDGRDFLVGAEDVRKDTSTAETTSTNLKAFGISVLTTVISSGVFTLDPPIPGVEKRLVFHTTGTGGIYVKTKNGETFASTQATTTSVIASSQTAYAAVTLIPVSTAIWAVIGSISSGYLRISGTT